MSITNPVAVQYANTQLRPSADRMAQLYNLCVMGLNNWNANGGSGILPPALPTLVAAAVGGTLATATYGYRVSALNARGETLASAEATVAVTGPTGKVTVSWTAVAGATSYNIYGRVVGGEGLLGNIAASPFVDTGSSIPVGFVPTSNTTGLIPNDSENIVDGSATDGRNPITGAQANNIVNRMTDIKNLMEGSAVVATNDGSKSLLNTVLAVAVNPNA